MSDHRFSDNATPDGTSHPGSIITKRIHWASIACTALRIIGAVVALRYGSAPLAVVDLQIQRVYKPKGRSHTPTTRDSALGDHELG